MKETTPDSTVNLTNSTEQSSGANRPTIGSTTISSSEAEIIKKEVRDIVQKAFPGINVNTDHPVSPNMRSGVSDTGKPSSGVIDLAGSMAHSAPLAIAGSEVSCGKYPIQYRTWGKQYFLFKDYVGLSSCNLCPDVCHGTVEAKRTSLLLWQKHRRCPYVDLPCAPLSHLYGR